MSIPHKTLDTLAHREAAYICRHYPGFQVSREDLQQEAWAVLLELADRFDPERGIPFGAYATLPLRRSLTAYAWQVEHITHVTSYAVQHVTGAIQLGKRHARSFIMMQADLDEETCEWVTLLDAQPSPEPSPEVQVEGMQIARVLVRAIDRAIIGAPHGPAAARVIIGQEVPRDIAADAQLPPSVIYRAAENTRRRLRKDRKLRRLYQEVTA